MDSGEKLQIVKLYCSKYRMNYIVLNKPIKLTYEKIGLDYVGSAMDIDGSIIASSLLQYRPYTGAFGGSEMNLNMKNGSISTIKDYWYDNGYYPEHGEFVSVGAGTLEGLQKCYAYFNYNIEKGLLDRLLSDYYARDREYTYDEIEQWCSLQYRWYDVIINGNKLPIMVNDRREFADRRSKRRVSAVVNRAKFFKAGDKDCVIRYSYFKYSYVYKGRLIKIERNLNEVLRESLGCRC